MKIDLIDLIFLAIGAWLVYYIYSLQNKNHELQSIINEQDTVLESQRIYIREVNKMLGINPYLYQEGSQPKKQSKRLI
jgi:hypothetical protein